MAAFRREMLERTEWRLNGFSGSWAHPAYSDIPAGSWRAAVKTVEEIEAAHGARNPPSVTGDVELPIVRRDGELDLVYTGADTQIFNPIGKFIKLNRDARSPRSELSLRSRAEAGGDALPQRS